MSTQRQLSFGSIIKCGHVSGLRNNNTCNDIIRLQYRYSTVIYCTFVQYRIYILRTSSCHGACVLFLTFAEIRHLHSMILYSTETGSTGTRSILRRNCTVSYSRVQCDSGRRHRSRVDTALYCYSTAQYHQFIEYDIQFKKRSTHSIHA